jgi:ribose-phosphate pyrophosphokinase
MMIIAGSASPRLSARLAKELKCRLVKPEVRRFPDGELYIRLPEETRREHAVVVQTTCNPQDENLMELFFLLDALKDLGARKITAVVPYLAYARQDKRFKPGEAVTLKTVVKLLPEAGAEELITLDIHEQRRIHDFPIPTKNLTAMPVLGKYLRRVGLRKPLIIGGDEGSEERAKLVAKELGAPYDYLVKRRVSPTKVVVVPKSLDARGHDAVIIDDIISTGGTILKAARVLKRQGALRIYAACTHGVFAEEVLQRLREGGIRRVITTDTIESSASVVSVAPLIARELR